MKILKTTARKVIIIIFVFVFTINTFVFAGVNPSREELELMIERVAEKRAIPAILLKAIARVESCYEHYRADGSPKINGTSIGLMQINNKTGGYDSERLKYDIMYNIEAGADVLLNKWAMSSYNEVASVGDMDLMYWKTGISLYGLTMAGHKATIQIYINHIQKNTLISS